MHATMTETTEETRPIMLVLVVERDLETRRLIEEILQEERKKGREELFPILEDDPQRALDIGAEGFGLVISGLGLAGEMDGVRLVGRLVEQNPDLLVVLMSDDHNALNEIERDRSLPEGAKILRKPFSSKEFMAVVSGLLSTQHTT